MIRPRPTIHVSADPFGLYTIGARVEQWGRPAATCPLCGAKLSRYRSLGDTRCAPCQLATTIDPDTLHPKPYVHKKTPPRHYGIHCPSCGGVKDKRSQQCRNCRYGLSA